ncbi:MAG: peptidoglycan DD-metalloendopeptidase family protein [Dechloromonas sp.]|nr:peptidoglycan DD-metalloendopeptidase family protein [Dechloromonas sp.]
MLRLTRLFCPLAAPPLPPASLGRQAVLLALALLWPLAPAQARPASQNSPEIAEKQADLGEIRQRIDHLRKDLSTSEDNRADAADRLRQAERQISRLQRELLSLAEQRNRLEKQLKTLDRQSEELGGTLKQQQAQLEKLIYQQYLRGTPDSLQLLLNGDDPNQVARDLHYLSAIALSRAELMGEINATLDKKKSLADDAKARSEELREVEAEQKNRHSELEAQREERKLLYAQISDKVKAQRKEIGNLQRDEKRMTELIDRLGKLLAQQAARAAEAKAAEARAAAEAAKPRPTRPPREAPAPVAKSEPAAGKASGPENRYEPVASDGTFPRLKGKLRLPVRGTLTGRYGSAREGGSTWRGVFIRADNGQPIKAIANGRVVFADWMRGFGNLLIVDHGDAYLTIYGNNDSLLKEVGQAVRGGETIASVGNTGGNPESGLYFEIRHKGQPIDPMTWASLK